MKAPEGCCTRCYYARGKRCTCKCGGKNHSGGYDQDKQPTIIEDFCKEEEEG